MSLLPKVERTVHLDVSPAELWDYIVTGELASLWMGGKMTVEAKINGRVTLSTEGSPLVFGTVEEITLGERITWTWRTTDGEPTQVTLHVESDDHGSLLSVTEEMLPYEIVMIPPVYG